MSSSDQTAPTPIDGMTATEAAQAMRDAEQTRMAHRTRKMGLYLSPTVHELANRFTYHAPKAGQPQIYEAVREKARDLATIMAAYCPPSDELARALDHLDNAVFCANAAIARHG